MFASYWYKYILQSEVIDYCKKTEILVTKVILMGNHDKYFYGDSQKTILTVNSLFFARLYFRYYSRIW